MLFPLQLKTYYRNKEKGYILHKTDAEIIKITITDFLPQRAPRRHGEHREIIRACLKMNE